MLTTFDNKISVIVIRGKGNFAIYVRSEYDEYV